MSVFRRAALAAAVAIGLMSPLALSAPARAAGTETFSADAWDLTGTGPAIPSSTTMTLFSTSTGAAVGSPILVGGTFTGLSDGTYVVKFHDGSGKYADGFSRSFTLPTDDGGQSSTGLRPVGPSQLGALLIHVTRLGKRDDCTRISVYPGSATQAEIDNYDVWSIWDGWDSGSGVFATLPSGNYKMRLDDDCFNHPSQWVGASGAVASSADAAYQFGVTSRTTKVISVDYKQSTTQVTSGDSMIFGTVTGGGSRLSGIKVDFYPAGSTDPSSPVDWTYTYSDGSYAESGLGAGDYIVRFSDPTSEFKPEYYNNVADTGTPTIPGGTTTASINSAGTTTVNADLAVNPTYTQTTGIRGVAKDNLGHALTNAYITFTDAGGNQIANARTRDNGSWRLTTQDIPPGQYRVAIQDWSSDTATWYSGNAPTALASTFVTVPVKGVATLNSVSTLNGLVKGLTKATFSANNNSFSGSVTAYDLDGNPVGVGSIDMSGNYNIDLAPGAYKLLVQASQFDRYAYYRGSGPSFVPQYYSAKYRFASANTVNVATHATTTAANTTLSRTLSCFAAPTITGTAKVGYTLTAHSGSWAVITGVKFTYKWYRGTTYIGAGLTHKAVAADKGKYLHVTVTATDSYGRYLAGTKASANRLIG